MSKFTDRLQKQREMLGEDWSLYLKSPNTRKFNKIKSLGSTVDAFCAPAKFHLSKDGKEQLNEFISIIFEKLDSNDRYVLFCLLMADIARYAEATDYLSNQVTTEMSNIIKDQVKALANVERCLNLGSQGDIKKYLDDNDPELITELINMQDRLSGMVNTKDKGNPLPEQSWLILKLAIYFYAATNKIPANTQAEQDGPFVRFTRKVFELIDQNFDHQKKLAYINEGVRRPTDLKRKVNTALELYKKRMGDVIR